LAKVGFGYGTEMWYHPPLHKNSKSGAVERFWSEAGTISETDGTY